MNAWGSGVMRGSKGVTIPGCRITMGRRITACFAWGAEKAQCKKQAYFLQYSTFASERFQVQTWGRETLNLLIIPGAISPLSVPGMGRKIKVQDNIHNDFNFCQVIFAPPSKWRPWHVPYPRYATGTCYSKAIALACATKKAVSTK